MARKGIYPASVKPGIPRLGAVPTGWVTVKLGDVLDVVERRVNLQPDAEYQLVTAKRSRAGIIHRGVLNGRDILTKTQYQVRQGDFLISRRQIVHGACGIVPTELDGAIVSNEYSALRTTHGLLLDYLGYLSHSAYFQQICFHSSVGVDVEKMVFKLDEWLGYPVHLPSLHEQGYICKLLSTWDRSIGTVRDLAQAKRTLRRYLLQSLLTGQLRSLAFVGESGFAQTRVGPIPTDWKVVRIHDVAEVNLQTLPERTSPDYRFKYLDLGTVKEGLITWPETSIAFGEAPSRARRVVRAGDVIMSTVRPNLEGFAIASFDTSDVVCSTGFTTISASSYTDAEFIYQCLYSDAVKKQLSELLVGSNYPAINKSDLKNLYIPYPSRSEERSAISRILMASEAEVHCLDRYLNLLVTQRDGLMQKLLTGQVRVKA